PSSTATASAPSRSASRSSPSCRRSSSCRTPTSPSSSRTNRRIRAGPRRPVRQVLHEVDAMGFVRDDRPDLFISYARGDDQADAEGEVGWITTLKQKLENRLFRPLGQNCDIWMDRRLATGSDLSRELEDRVRASALLLIVLSPGYLQSSWCEREM